MQTGADGKLPRINTKSYTIMNDADRLKKEHEEERRIMRIKEVREESKNLARKIRNDVAAEKDKQLRNLEAIKTRELNCWRENVMANKYHDYRSAIFQVGTAHAAAQAERLENQKQAKSSYKNFRKQAIARRCNTRSTENKENTPKLKLTKKNVCAQTQTSPLPKAEKRKREGCKRCMQHVCFCQLDDRDLDDDDDDDICDYVCEPVKHCLPNHRATHCTTTREPLKSSNLQKTGLVLQDEPSDCSCDNFTLRDLDINDHHVQENRKFCHVTRQSPQKSPRRDSKPCTTKAVRTDDQNSALGQSKRTPSAVTTPRTASPEAPKRFTKISQLLKKSNEGGTAGEMPRKLVTRLQPTCSPRKVAPAPPNTASSNRITTPTKSATQPAVKRTPTKASPLKRPSTVTKKSPPKLQKPAAVSKAQRAPPSPSTLSKQAINSAKSIRAVSLSAKTYDSRTTQKPSEASSSDKVQFYDYNTKFEKKYEQPASKVQAEAEQPCSSHKNAIQLAMEEREQQAQCDSLSARQRDLAAERGQKALERENVRRECNELTEKLDALMKQYPRIVPSDVDFIAGHRYNEAAARKESKMNAKVAAMLAQPTVITCPEVNQPSASNPSAKLPRSTPANINLNIGKQHANDNLVDKDISTDSCCSILLGYVNAQGKELQQDMHVGQSSNPQKQAKLRRLLERIDELRNELLQQLKQKPQQHGTQNVQQVKNIIDSLSAVRNEREELSGREQELKQKEATLKHKAKELYEKQKKQEEEDETNEGRVQILEAVKGKSVEIIIKVPGSHKVRTTTRKKQAQPREEIVKTVKSTKEKPSAAPAAKRQNSYDSNSTAYRSLPKELPNHIDNFVKKLMESKETEKEEKQEINPQLAHYVQRLLGMSRKSVRELGVSSTDVETPHSSTINTTGNLCTTTNTTTTTQAEDSLISNEKLKEVERFIVNNRGFIEDLERSIRAGSNPNESFDAIWKQRFGKKAGGKHKKVRISTKKSNTKVLATMAVTTPHKTKSKPKINGRAAQQKAEVQAAAGKEQPSQKATPKTSPKPQKVSEAVQTRLPSPAKAQDKESEIERYAELTGNCTQRIKELTELITKVRLEKRKLLEVTLSSVSDTGRNSTEYLDLPEMQKKHSSAHAGAGALQTTDPSMSTISNDASTQSDESKSKLLDTNLVNEMAAASKTNTVTQNSTAASPLPSSFKHTTLHTNHKQIGASVDSGISMSSRPMTAQDVHQEHEPMSYTSESSNTAHHMLRRQKPPPTLKRFSPHMMEVNEVVHELSTITEVETPATSRVNFTNQQSKVYDSAATPRSTTTMQKEQQTCPCPFTFPTFEEYVKEMRLDLTQLDDEQSFKLQKEYSDFIAVLKDARTNTELNYDEFPSLAAYLEQLAVADQTRDELNRKANNTIDGLFNDARTLKDHKAYPFPSSQEYMAQRKTTNTPDTTAAQLLDTESLENITENVSSLPTPSDDSNSDSLNIEEELRRRNILQSSFRRVQCTSEEHKKYAESTRHEDHDSSAIYKQLFAGAESGIEKLSTSNSLPSSIERQKQNLGMKKVTVADAKEKKQRQGNQEDLSFPTPHDSMSQNSKECPQELGRPLNLREFLTRELLKHANSTISSASSSSSDESFRGSFFKSVIGSLSPHGGLAGTGTNTGTALTLDRQKTSTPVVSSQAGSLSHSNSHSHSNSGQSVPTSTQLFSGESRLSSVHFNEQPSLHYIDNGANTKDDKRAKPKQ